jgi:PIN domain nuclease of toxin-antitoxin system
MNPILLDTQVAIWSALGQLSAKTCDMIDAAADRDDLLLSPISAWEIGMLVLKRRLALAMNLEDYVRVLFERSGAVIATAAAYGARLVTRDRNILNYARTVPHLRCIAC